MYLRNINKEELNNYTIKAFEGNVVLIDRMESFIRYIGSLRNQKILGFDTETKPSFRKGRRNKVSLLQLAFDSTAYLFRLNRIGVPPEITRILSDPDIIKVGVAVHDDIKILQELVSFKPAGFIDLQKMVKEYGIESSSLKKITAIVLGFRISKSQQVTDWEAPILTRQQKVYAATDAWVCYEIYRSLTCNNQ